MCPESRGKGKRENRWLVSAVPSKFPSWCLAHGAWRLAITNCESSARYSTRTTCCSIRLMAVASLDSWAAAGATLSEQEPLPPGHFSHLCHSGLHTLAKTSPFVPPCAPLHL